jgi:hypothetical protein
MPLPRTLCRFPLQAAAMRSLPRSGLVQQTLYEPIEIEASQRCCCVVLDGGFWHWLDSTLALSLPRHRPSGGVSILRSFRGQDGKLRAVGHPNTCTGGLVPAPHSGGIILGL